MLIVHGCHHRAGTVWLSGVLRSVAHRYGLRYQNCTQDELTPATDVFVQDHSVVDRDRLAPYRGSHLIRDPRDLVVSGYFYHLWTKEAWARVPDPKYENRSFQQYLNSVSQEEGLLAEMRWFAERSLPGMVNWDYEDPDFIEVRYEDLTADEASVFRQVFQHYGFSGSAIETSLRIAQAFSFERQAQRKVGEVRSNDHLRSGQPSQWRDVFGEEHIALGRELLGDALIKLGYETGLSW